MKIWVILKAKLLKPALFDGVHADRRSRDGLGCDCGVAQQHATGNDRGEPVHVNDVVDFRVCGNRHDSTQTLKAALFGARQAPVAAGLSKSFQDRLSPNGRTSLR